MTATAIANPTAWPARSLTGGALIAAGPGEISAAKILGFLAVILASVNIFGGFIVTQRMLQMFRRKPR